MNMSENCNQKLKQWVACDTWHKTHDRDMSRFYDFVDSYIKDNGLEIIDESTLAEAVALQAGIKTIDPRFYTIKERVSLMYTIIDFLKATGRK